MSYVYLVDDGCEVAGVYRSLKKAQASLPGSTWADCVTIDGRRYWRGNGNDHWHWCIDRLELDAPIDHTKALRYE